MQAFTQELAKLITLAAASFALSAAAAGAGTVNISADGGNVQISGQVSQIEDRSITIKTDVGLLTFDVDAIKCEGTGCPRALLDKVQPTSSAVK